MRARFDFMTSKAGPVQFADPVDVLDARALSDVRPVFVAAEEALRQGLYVAGWVAYEAAPAFDGALKTRGPSSFPLVRFGLYREMSLPDRPLEAPGAPSAIEHEPVAWRADLSKAAHAEGIATVRGAIARGETYQINYTFPLKASMPVSPVSPLYRTLATQARAPYAALIETDDWQVLSLSPELFFSVDAGTITTQPMKGTAARGRWPDEDAALGAALHGSQKNRAENVMIVDLCRNDLSRVCAIGSVRASSLFDVVRYPTVWQMVSTVTGELRRDATLTRIFEALFPAGSITGAPKASSMRLISELEPEPRGVYCGAVGYAAPDGTSVFSVAIRTAVVETANGRARFGVGGGITWDSAANDEYAEALQKAACLEPVPDFRLFETLRVEDGRCVRLDGHLRRLRESAAFFDFPFDESAIRKAVDDAISPLRHFAISPLQDSGTSPSPHLPSSASVRLRLSLSRAGSIDVKVLPLDMVPAEPTVMLATTPVDSQSVWLFHKTTRREVYDAHAAAHPNAFDVLLWNERGELTEFTRGNVVLELDGHLVTPARSSGLLAGVLRQELVDSSDIVEAAVTKTDIQRTTRVWFINSLRGWVEVKLAG